MKAPEKLLQLLGIKRPTQQEVNIVAEHLQSESVDAVKLFNALQKSILGPWNENDLAKIKMWLAEDDTKADEYYTKLQALHKQLESDVLKDFPNFAVFCIGEHGKGGCIVHAGDEHGETYLIAQIVETFQSRPDVRRLFEDALMMS